MKITYVESLFSPDAAIYLFIDGIDVLVLPKMIQGTEAEKEIIKRAEDGEIEIQCCD